MSAGCSDTVRGSNDERLTNVGMNEGVPTVSQPLVVAASRNHPLLDSALVLWLISSSPLHLTPFLPRDYARVQL